MISLFKLYVIFYVVGRYVLRVIGGAVMCLRLWGSGGQDHGEMLVRFRVHDILHPFEEPPG